jgi:drug/metabolite transporter (DMT)-like permease
MGAAAEALIVTLAFFTFASDYSAAAFAAYTNVYAKRYGHVWPPLITLPPSMLLGGAPLLLVGLATESVDWSRAHSAPSLAALLYLAIFGSGLALFSILWLLARLSAGIVGISTLIFPVIAVAAGAFFGGERFTMPEAAFVVTGIAAALIPQEERRTFAFARSSRHRS